MRRVVGTPAGRVLSAARRSSSIGQPTLGPFSIVDSTLREGEQFATADFTSNDRLYIAKMLDKIGVEYIEMVNPLASTGAVNDIKAIRGMNLKAKIVTHTRCAMPDVERAIESGVQGVNMYMATSPILAQHSHGKGIDEVIKTAEKVITAVREAGLEVRFSCEDAFRSNLDDILTIYQAVASFGVDRVGVADTVGIATPRQVEQVIRLVRSTLGPDIGMEFHVHNDTGCCIANALVALECGATHIDTSILGLGERNGITPLGGFLARLYTIDKDAVMKKYRLDMLHHLEKYVSVAADAEVPFNNYVTGRTAFTHKAGVHSKAVLTNPAAYEIIDPVDFGVSRHIQVAHRLTGWNVMHARAKELHLDIPVEKIKALTETIKNMADEREKGFTMDELDRVLISVASGPRYHGEFMRVGGSLDTNLAADKDVRDEVEAVVQKALPKDTSAPDEHSLRLQFSGHLFDKGVMNRVLDLLVELPCQFKVVKLQCPKVSEDISVAVVEVTSTSEEVLTQTRKEIESIGQAYAEVAEFRVQEVGRGTPGRAQRECRVCLRGHLFDKNIFNRVLDVIVISECDYEVAAVDVAPRNEETSSVVIHLSHKDEAPLEKVLTLMQMLVHANGDAAACSMEVL